MHCTYANHAKCTHAHSLSLLARHVLLSRIPYSGTLPLGGPPERLFSRAGSAWLAGTMKYFVIFSVEMQAVSFR
jgi:hypothetical protein